MKISIGYRIQEGPWGGGNRFALSLAEAAKFAGHKVVFDLYDDDIDIILLTDPRPRSPSVSFSAGAIHRYLLLRNPNAIVVHRINECDERKGTRHMNTALVRANSCADFTVFVGGWLVDLPCWKRHLRTPHAVILNGADERLFNADGFEPWNGSGPLRLVTHHWGGNWMKGFDIYNRLDQMLGEPEWKDRLAFTYVGNLPSGFKFVHSGVIAPLDGQFLVDELKRHHGYLTASINEPGGNHQNEAGCCGLPLLYRKSGCLPEYCAGYGVEFDETDFPVALERYIIEYHDLTSKMSSWPHRASLTSEAYLSLFGDLLRDRKRILGLRRLWRNPWQVLRNQIPF